MINALHIASDGARFTRKLAICVIHFLMETYSKFGLQLNGEQHYSFTHFLLTWNSANFNLSSEWSPLSCLANLLNGQIRRPRVDVIKKFHRWITSSIWNVEFWTSHVTYKIYSESFISLLRNLSQVYHVDSINVCWIAFTCRSCTHYLFNRSNLK